MSLRNKRSKIKKNKERDEGQTPLPTTNGSFPSNFATKKITPLPRQVAWENVAFRWVSIGWPHGICSPGNEVWLDEWRHLMENSCTLRRPTAAIIGPDIQLESTSTVTNCDAALVSNRSVTWPPQSCPSWPPWRSGWQPNEAPLVHCPGAIRFKACSDTHRSAQSTLVTALMQLCLGRNWR